MEELRTLYRAIQEEAPAPDVADQQHNEPPVAALGVCLRNNVLNDNSLY